MPSPNVSETATHVFRYTINNGPFTNLGTTATYAFSRNTISVRTTNFKKLKRSLLPDNPYSYAVITHIDRERFPTSTDMITGSPSTFYTVQYYANCFDWGCDFTKGPLADDPYQRVVQLVNQQLSLSKTQLAVTLAEAHKTAHHVAMTAVRLADAYRSLRKFHLGDFFSALGITKKISVGAHRKMRDAYERDSKAFASKTWLEYSYGWKPLLKDVYDSAEALAELAVEHQYVVRQATARFSTELAKDTGFTGSSSSMWEYRKYSRSKRGCFLKVKYRIPSSSISPAKAFGLENPLSVAWELVPFSFVADWFIPIGVALEALTAHNGLVFAGGVKTTKEYHTILTEFRFAHGLVTGGHTYGGSGSGSATKEWFNLDRVVLISWPEYGVPRFKDPRSFAHAASAIALLQQVFSSASDVVYLR